ncbi:hypothetical protein H0A36_14545 [Endozoicomonas sp. SM1973]|uniref:CdiI immunity protein domain-containing protein n=1 Tax=Spartinivicinus marinus TaxID=2994442 RepID=A0A853IB14_9GAMM|nr:contact-dependent growth inhibition system immunity protein [Spartinivicinus marinus]MCX4028567.1 contact-dependent growth inhibition system immunity protein [Spartinivicinus marinus]NYZ67234.1 hypothetical protein [Spartinivicinus marinus]
MINATDFPYVRSFLSAYFHQDWLDEYTSLDEAIEEYCSCGNIEDRKLALSELKSLTRLAEAGEFNEADLLSFSCYFQPSVNNITLSDWLEYVSTFIANKLQIIR